MKKNTKPKPPAVYIPTAAEMVTLDAAIEARGGWVDITTPPLGTPEQREAIGWQEAYKQAGAAMNNYSVQQSPNAMKLFALLVDIFADAEPGNWFDEFIRITKREYLARVGRAGGKKGAEAQAKLQAENLKKVREAFEKLPAAKRERDAAGIICAKTKLSAGTVRTHLKTVRAEMKAQ